MKKIILLVVTILIAGMLTGCASTSGVSNTSKISNKSSKAPFNGVYEESISDVYDDVYWYNHDEGYLLSIACDLNKVYQLKKSSDPDQQYRIQNTFNKIINSQKISGRDYNKLFWCNYKMNKESTYNSYKFFTLEDFLYNKEIEGKNSITGAIINNTDKILHIGIYTRRHDQRHFYFEVQPHEKEYFKILGVTDLNESFFGIEDIYMSDVARIGIGSPDEDKETRSFEYRVDLDLLDRYTKYLFDNYSFEMTFDENISQEWRKNLNTWFLVPRYETEENILTDALSYREIEVILNKYR